MEGEKIQSNVGVRRDQKTYHFENGEAEIIHKIGGLIIHTPIPYNERIIYRCGFGIDSPNVPYNVV